MRTLVLALLVAALAPSAVASAQAKKVEWNLGAGVSFPEGKIKDDLNTGWNGAIGVTFFPVAPVGFQVEYMYQHFNGPSRTFPNLAPSPQDNSTITIDSNHQLHTFTFNLVARAGGNSAVGFYVLAGPGYYHRIVQLTSDGVGFISVCDPYWLVCYPAAVETTQVIGDRSTNDFGFNVGAGLTFGHREKFYVEGRYHYVWGPKAALSAALNSDTSTSAQYFPITFGFRF